jgi:hypothetical protein
MKALWRRLKYVALASVLMVPMFSFLLPETARAAGETWVFNTDNAFEIRGGDLSQPTSFSNNVGEVNPLNSDSRFSWVTSELWADSVATIYRGTLRHESGCTIVMDLAVPLSDGGSDLFTAVTGGSCSNAIKAGYNQQTIDGDTINDERDDDPTTGTGNFEWGTTRGTIRTSGINLFSGGSPTFFLPLEAGGASPDVTVSPLGGYFVNPVWAALNPPPPADQLPPGDQGIYTAQQNVDVVVTINNGVGDLGQNTYRCVMQYQLQLTGPNSGNLTVWTNRDSASANIGVPEYRRASDNVLWTAPDAATFCEYIENEFEPEIPDTVTIYGDPGGIVAVTAPVTPAGADDPPPPGGDDVAAPPNFCEQQGGVLGWIACPIMEWIVGGITSVSGFITSLLKLDTCTIFNEPYLTGQPCDPVADARSSQAYQGAWRVFRNLAYALLIIFALVMVVSQVAGLELLDAYTIRKTLPKLIAAVIGVALSWEIMEFLYKLSNDAADAVMALIQAPFRGTVDEATTAATATAFLTSVGLAGVAGAGAAVIFVGLGGIGVVLSLLATVGLFVFSFFLLIAGRNVAATLLVLIMPVLIMLGAFEPTKKAFSFGRGIGATILISVATVAAVLTATNIAALIAFAAGGVINVLTGIFFLIGGIALVWTLFIKLDTITGYLGNVANKVTGRMQKGLSDYRSRSLKQRYGLWKQGALGGAFGQGTAGIGRRIGAAGMYNATRGGGGLTRAFGLSGSRAEREALLGTYDNVIRDELEKNPALAALANNDDAMAVLAGSGGVDTQEALARSAALAGLSGDRARSAIAAARSVGVSRGNAQTALRMALKNKGRGIAPGNVRFLDHAVRALSGSQAEYSGLAYEAAYFARSSGRADLGGTEWVSWQTEGAGAGPTYQRARQEVQDEEDRRTAARAGGSVRAEDQARTAEQQETDMWRRVADQNMLDGIRRVGPQAMVAGHDNQVIQALDTLARVLTTSADPDDRLQAAVALKELQGNLPAGASGSVRDHINGLLYNAPDAEIPGLGLNSTGNIAQQLGRMAGLDDDPTHTLAGQTVTTRGRTYPEYTGAGDPRTRPPE